MKKYFIIFCSLLIMFVSLFFITPVHGLTCALSNQETINEYNYFTSIDNLQMIYIKDTEQSNDFFSSSTNSFPIPDDGTITGSTSFSSDVSDVGLTFGSTSSKAYLGNRYDTRVAWSFGQLSSTKYISLYYGEFFMPINRPWSTIGNTELRYLIQPATTTTLSITLSCVGYYPVLMDNGFYMQKFGFENIPIEFASADVFEFSLYSLLTDYVDYSQYIHNNFLYISYASLNIACPDQFEFEYFFNRIENYVLPSINDYEVSLDIDISPFGTALLNGVTNFLRFELLPGFSLLDLLFYCCAVPLLIAILKIFLGG